MKKLVEIIKKICASWLLNEELKQKLIDKLAKKINIPFASKQLEKETVTVIIDEVFDELNEAIQNIKEDEKNAEG